MSKQTDLITKLLELTIQDKIQWEDKSSPISTNYFETEYKGFRFFTEWLRDEKPCLGIGKVGVGCDEVIVGYHIQDLIRVARIKCETPEKIAERQKKVEVAREMQSQDTKRKEEFLAGILESLKE